MSTFLLSIISASSLPFPVIVPTFRVPILSPTLLPFLFSLCLRTLLPPLLLRPTVAQFPPAPCRSTAPMAVVVNPGLDRSAYRALSGRSAGDAVTGDVNDGKQATSTTDPGSGSVTERSNTSKNDKSSHILYLITSSPKKSENEMPGQWLGRGRTAAHNTMWAIYALAALLTLTVIATVAKLVLHMTVKSPTIPSVSSSDSCSQSTTSEPWIIFYRPSTISLFKKKLKNHHGDLSPLVGN
ncbi:hypothetical protein QTP70_032197 [Hemibagrus guttatus]|uniref:Uncharacterized protein n=1 Tax=Hemibagrus guttatus TaxID=175788 RepID=A0AAE0Q6N1_9TELE|nr:hypothetical protein QTP70_032197 [Hemibagrus guttatus]